MSLPLDPIMAGLWQECSEGQIWCANTTFWNKLEASCSFDKTMTYDAVSIGGWHVVRVAYATHALQWFRNVPTAFLPSRRSSCVSIVVAGVAPIESRRSDATRRRSDPGPTCPTLLGQELTGVLT